VISSAPEFCTENPPIFQCLGFGTKLFDIVEKLFFGASQKFSRPLARRLEKVPGTHPA
jgi:hypothetical protein